MRLGVYIDYVYKRDGDVVSGERAFVRFMTRLGESFDSLVVFGRLDPLPGQAPYVLPRSVEFVPLPYYASGSRPLLVLRALTRSMHRFWRGLDRVDVVWLLGPTPLTIPFAVLAAAHGTPAVLGVRQNFPACTRARHPGRPWLHVAARALDAGFRMLARRRPVVVTGAELARRYSRAAALLQTSGSVVSEADVASVDAVDTHSYAGELRVLSVGRIDPEKNPLLLADTLARLCERDRRWRLIVCGDGPLDAELRARLEGLGVAENAELLGYVPFDGQLIDIYRESHFFLHVSWTEGEPQVISEALATGVPVVATAVGGVPEAVGPAGLLVPPGDASAAAAALTRLAEDESLRSRLVEAGLARARERTLESECRRVATFIRRTTAGQQPPG